MYISVRGIDCASVSVILGLGFETVLLWYFSFHNAFDHYNLTINKTVPHVGLNLLTLPITACFSLRVFVCCVGSRWILFVFPSILMQNRVTVLI